MKKSFPRPSNELIHQDRQVAFFTLVELMVILAIIAILMSLLLPSLGKARKSATNVICVSQVKQISLAMNQYAGDNGNYLPFGGYPEIRYGYDDLIYEYLSYDIADSDRERKGVPRANFTMTNNVFFCPDDTLERAQIDTEYPRSYSMNRNRQSGLGYLGIAWLVNRNNNYKTSTANALVGSRKITFLPDPSGTMLLTERPSPSSTVGGPGPAGTTKYSGITEGPEDQVLNAGPTHFNSKFNYSFIDGHVETLHYKSNIGTGTPDAPRGMWSIDAND